MANDVKVPVTGGIAERTKAKLSEFPQTGSQGMLYIDTVNDHQYDAFGV